MRKTLGIIAGLALFVVGTVTLVSYVQGAEDRLEAAEQLVEVVVLSQPVDAGADARGSLRLESVPARLLHPDAVLPDDSLDGFVALVDLVVGEQLLWTRLGRPGEVEAAVTTRGEIAKGHTAVTVRLAPERAFGGLLLPGMRVAVIGSFSLDLAGVETDYADQVAADFGENVEALSSVDTSHVLVKTASIVEVQTEVPIAQEAVEGEAAVSPEGDFLVTLAVPLVDAERIVFAAEWGSIWLVRHGPAVDLEDSRVQTTASVYTQAAEQDQTLADLSSGSTPSDGNP